MVMGFANIVIIAIISIIVGLIGLIKNDNVCFAVQNCCCRAKLNLLSLLVKSEDPRQAAGPLFLKKEAQILYNLRRKRK